MVLLALLGIGLCGNVSPALSMYRWQNNPDAVLVGLRGRVLLKRQNWQRYEAVGVGTPLHRGDLLRVDDNSEAVVLCSADGTKKNVASGFSGVPCPAEQASASGNVAALLLAVFRQISLVGPTRSGQPGDVPIIVTPRATKILNPRPVLRWTPPAGAGAETVYNITLVARGRAVWSKEVKAETQLTYPSEGAPRLVPGESYMLVVEVKGCTSVEAAGCSSKKDTQPGIGFRLLKDEAARPVRETAERIRRLGLSADATALLTAKFYVSEGLFAEAIQLLEPLTKTMPATAVEQSLGDSYLATGLARLAEEHYLKALQIAQAADDKEGQGAAERALGYVYQQIGNTEESEKRLRRALTLYTNLGDAETAREVQKQIDELKPAQR